MSHDDVVAAALAAAGLPTRIEHRQRLGGGSDSSVERLRLAGGRTVVAKSATATAAARLTAERGGLDALRATATVAVVAVLGAAGDARSAALILADVGSATHPDWTAFGHDLARLHDADAGQRYGFAGDNFLGDSPQPNDWCDDWVEFTARRRLGHQAGIAARTDALEATTLRRIERLVEHLDRYLPRTPRPALLHGDLWAGNALANDDGRVVLIDPAVYVGDRWADIAMMQLFGGFPTQCLRAYAERSGERNAVAERILVYQIYHLLNHVNLFGAGYRAPLQRLLDELRL